MLPKIHPEIPQQMPSNVSVSVDHTYNNRHRTQTKHRSLKTLKTARTARGESTYTAQVHTTANDMIQEEIENFDKMALYKTYFPLNNYDYLIKRYHKYIDSLELIASKKCSNVKIIWNYRFTHLASSLNRKQLK